MTDHPPPFTPKQEVKLHALNLAIKYAECTFIRTEDFSADVIVQAAEKFENYIGGREDESS